MSKMGMSYLIQILFVFSTVLFCKGQTVLSVEEVKDFSRFYFVRSIVKHHEQVNKKDVNEMFTLINKVTSLSDTAILLTLLEKVDDVRFYKAEHDIQSIFIDSEVIFAIHIREYDYETYDLNKNNIIDFVNRFFLEDVTKASFNKIINIMSEIFIGSEATIFAAENKDEFNYLINEYKIEPNNQIVMEDGNYYYEQFFKTQKGNVISYYVLLYKYENNQFDIEEQLLFRLLE